MQFDAIIIGAGLSGLAAGIRLAHYGKKVRIFERHHLPGGLNSCYQRNGKTWDVGLHAMTNFAPSESRSAPLPQLLRQLRIRREDLQLVPQTISSISFPDAKLVLNNDFMAFREQVGSLFPRSLNGFDRLCTKLMPYNQFALADHSVSTRAVLAEFLPDEQFREMLLLPVMYYGSSTSGDIAFPRFSVLFQSIFREGLMRPKFGMGPFLQTLTEKFTRDGGELCLGNGIAQLHSNGDVIQEAIDDNGESHQADIYISCAGACETAALFSSDTPAMGNSLPAGNISFLEAMFQLDRHPSELGLQECIQFCNSEKHFDFQPPQNEAPSHFPSYLITAAGNYQSCQEIPDAKTIRFSTLASPDFWLNADSATYTATKSRVCEDIIRFLDAKYPGFAQSVQSADMFTPKTIRRFTGKINGAIYGTPDKYVASRTECKNLLLAGTDQGLLGIVGALLSGSIAANLALS